MKESLWYFLGARGGEEGGDIIGKGPFPPCNDQTDAHRELAPKREIIQSYISKWNLMAKQVFLWILGQNKKN